MNNSVFVCVRPFLILITLFLACTFLQSCKSSGPMQIFLFFSGARKKMLAFACVFVENYIGLKFFCFRVSLSVANEKIQWKQSYFKALLCYPGEFLCKSCSSKDCNIIRADSVSFVSGKPSSCTWIDGLKSLRHNFKVISTGSAPRPDGLGALCPESHFDSRVLPISEPHTNAQLLPSS